MFYLLAGSIIKWLSLKKVFLFWVFLTLIIAPKTVNAQGYLILNPADYTYPQWVQGDSSGRAFVFPWAPVAAGSITQHLVFLDNLPNDSTGTTTIVQWNIAWYNMYQSQVVFESPLTVSLNGYPALAAGMVDVGQCSTNGCHGALDLLATVCDGGIGSTCTVPPPKTGLVLIGFAATKDGSQVGKLAPPTIQMYDKNGDPVGDPLKAIWLDQVQQNGAWVSTVTFGRTGNDCTLAVVNLSPTQTVRPIATATLTGEGLSFIGTTVLPLNLYDQFQMATFQCSQLFPQIAGMPATSGVIEVSFSGGEGAIGIQQQTSAGITPVLVLPLVHPARQEPRPPVIRRPHLSHPLVTSSDD